MMKLTNIISHWHILELSLLSEQVEECKSQLIDEVDLRVSTMVPNVLNIKVWYKNCLIIEHLTQFDVQYINNGAAG